MKKCIKVSGMEPRRARRRHLNPKIREGAEWAVAAVAWVLGTVAAVAIAAAVVATLM